MAKNEFFKNNIKRPFYENINVTSYIIAAKKTTTVELM